MTHKGDPDPDLGCWGVEDCMGQVRGYDFDAVIGIGGRSWWTDQTSRVGEIVWIGVGPQVVIEGRRGPVLRFAHFRYFQEGELVLRQIAPKLGKAMYNCRLKLYGFSQLEEQEIKRICRLAMKAGPSASSLTQGTDTQMKIAHCRRRLRRRICRKQTRRSC
jgi:hypothetical protein